MREEFWDTAPHYGGNKGEPACLPATVTLCWSSNDTAGVLVIHQCVRACCCDALRGEQG